jgi:hypothetical protein
MSYNVQDMIQHLSLENKKFFSKLYFLFSSITDDLSDTTFSENINFSLHISSSSLVYLKSNI